MKKLTFITLILLVIASCSPKKITWVAIGDSITYLNEYANETGNRVTKGYMTRVVNELPNVVYTNQGHNGWTSGDIADSINELGIPKADVYSVFLGTNDWWAGRPVGILSDYQENKGNGTVYGSFRIIIDKIRNLNHKARIILITPMQRVDFVQVGNLHNNAWGSYKEKNGQSLAQFAEAIATIANYENFSLVDLYSEPALKIEDLVKFKRLKDPLTNAYKDFPYPRFFDIPFNPDTDEYPYPLEAIDITYDGLHPSDKGFGIIAEKLVKIMKEY